MAELDEREEEIEAIQAIYPELTRKANGFDLVIPVIPLSALLIRFVPTDSLGSINKTYAGAAAHAAAYIERDVYLSHLPPLLLSVTLPEGYPVEAPPSVSLKADPAWLPHEKLRELENDVQALWEDFGKCQILFSYIDSLQQAAERAFDLSHVELSVAEYEQPLTKFDAKSKQEAFEGGTYDCGICLEPKKGTKCFKLSKCGHIFCKACFQDFYHSAIMEGDVASVRCLDPTCGKDSSGQKRRRTDNRSIHPRELLGMGVDESKVRRYVEMKRKKRQEADKNTVYCPRTWCQGPAKSPKYPPIPTDLSGYPSSDSSDDESNTGGEEDGRRRDVQPDGVKATTKAADSRPDPTDRLAICEKCSLAFCRVCYMGWHGPFARCYPRDPSELSAEEKASYDYIRMHTSPCPTCSSPTQKTMGCNHMRCFNCNTHFCYLCGSWLDGNNPYQHFNKGGTPCYQRLWELEEGDEGQAPDDGRGFAGGRGWEQLAIEAAREADAQEAAAAAAAAQAEQQQGQQVQREEVDQIIAFALQQIELDEPPQAPAPPRPPVGRRRRRNMFGPPQRADGVAEAVRAHERAGRQMANARRRPPANEDDVQQQELRRFVEMAQQDQEEEWDSDELGEEEGFRIQ